jgi:hypothetical protein
MKLNFMIILIKLSSPALVILPISASPGIKQINNKKRAIQPPMNVL